VPGGVVQRAFRKICQILLHVAYVDWRDGPVDYTRDYGLTFHPFYRLQVRGTS
jgi:hypothetical protein